MSARKKAPPKPMPLDWDHASVHCTGAGWHFVIPVAERVNAVWRQWRGRTVVSAKHRADKAEAPARFRHIAPLTGDVAATLLWVRERRVGDVDGRIKATLDLLRGIAYADDAQVADCRILRVDDFTEAPRMEILVTPCEARTMADWRAITDQRRAA